MSSILIFSNDEDEQERYLSLQNTTTFFEEYLVDEREDLYQDFIKSDSN